MSEPIAPVTTTPIPAEAPQMIDADELKSLDGEDVQAGKVIAQLLCFFFLYTIVVTTIAAWWTWDAIR